MNRIDKIISESIDRFILQEIDEARGRRDPWTSFERVKTTVIKPDGNAVQVPDATTGRGKKVVDNAIGRQPKPPKKRAVAKDFFSANPENASQIRRTLRKAWQPKLSPMYHMLDSFTKQYGMSNAKGLMSLFGEADKNGKPIEGPATKYNQEYDNIERITTDIEGYGNDTDHIKKKLLEIPDHLRNIINLCYILSDKCAAIRRIIATGNNNFKMSIINGYITSPSGLSNKVIWYRKDSNEMNDFIGYLNKLIECIEINYTLNTVDMYDNLGITTKRR